MNNLPKRKAFNFYSSYDEAFEVLEDKHQIKLFKAVRDVQFFRTNINDIKFNDKELMFAWLIIKHSVESQILGYCRANKIKYEDINFTTIEDTPEATIEDTPPQVQGEEQEQVEVEEQVEYTIAIQKEDLSRNTIDYLNKQGKKRFGHGKGNMKEILSQINKLLKDGNTLKQIEDKFAYVVNVKCQEWNNNTEMNKHLNPVTLFRESNFDRYLNQEMKVTQSDMISAVYEARKRNANG